MKPKFLLQTLVLVGAVLCAWNLSGQNNPNLQLPAASPGCTLKQRVGFTDIEISYSRPSVKGRKIFGGIVPYGQVWRTGANQSTKLRFSTDVKLNGVSVPAGEYALYTIPGEEEWTIILSKNTQRWGAYGYDSKDDLARFTVSPQTLGQPVETLTIELGRLRDDSAVIYLIWDKTLVPLQLQLDLVPTLLPKIDAAMAAPGEKSPGLCYQAASFYYDHGQDLKKPLEWVNGALTGNPSMAFELLHLKAKILARLGQKEEAITAAKKSTELALKAEGPSSSFIQMNQALISSLQ